MNALAMVVVLLALVGAVLLWKVLLVAAGIGGAQWLLVSIVDSPPVQVLAFGVPALLLALVLSRGLPIRPRLSLPRAERAGVSVR
ncbi:hypothetical protein [Actinokineospora fastidiosa]|uniref:Uncharacterized protein n=1 Tax=Actinokineospora fastidiosa TaxID=1816 RepID=A0A918GTW0_9PSEU|nr:hypothetical protein [Actinokineospora fastidiosa]GGS61386.1 hypothetical protein GCM10010171_65240 [Actinokineospora fastidiosa]